MNNQKGSWKTGHFKWIQILLCIVPLFVPSWATIPYEEVKFKFFDNNDPNAESEILKSLQITKNVFALPAVQHAVLLGLAAGIAIELIAPATNMIFVVVNLLAYESDWRQAFSKTIANELERGIALGHVNWMKATMDTINAKFDLIRENNPERQRASIARFIHRELDRMLNLFASSESFVKKYPRLGTPLLLTLAQFVALFEPMAKTLIKQEAMTPELSCKMSNILQDYRPRMVDARFDKLHEDSTKGLVIYRNLLRYRIVDSYSKPKPATFDCEKGCIVDIGKGKICMIDDFGVDWHAIAWPCVVDYLSVLRHRIEDMFSVELLDSLCVNKPQATGFGWVTIKIREVKAVLLANKKRCEFGSKCDPFVRLSIDGKLVLETRSETNSEIYEVGVTYTSPKISKNALIKMELYDDDIDNNPELVLRVEGNVDSFLRDGYKYERVRVANGRGYKDNPSENYMDTISFWQDEYNYKNV